MGVTRQLMVFSIVLSVLRLSASSVHAAPQIIANASFETPAYSDGGYAALIPPAAQGGYGWSIGDGAGIYNPPAADYSGAAAGGTPLGADGSQVGWISGFGDYQIVQRLAGADGMPGNGDDPTFEPFTIYTLKVTVGQRAAGNVFGAINGGYDIQLRAGDTAAAPMAARETDAVALTPGAFVERTIVWDSALAGPEILGQPLVIRLRKTIVGTTTDTDFDNVRLDATFVPPTADFDDNGVVDGVDLTIWKAGFGMSGAITPTQGDVDRNLRIDGGDFLLWQRQLGIAGAVAPASEPSAGSLGLLSLGGGALAVRRGRAGSLRWVSRSK
jgi:hypothetical protein